MKKTIVIDGINLHYNIEGDGTQAVIVMHGWGCSHSTVKSLADASLGKETTVYNLDLPGFGDSTEPETVWGIERYTALLEKFVEALGIINPYLIGHSFGGRMAIEYSSRNQVGKLVLVDAAGIKPRRTLRYYFKVYSFKTAKFFVNTFLPNNTADALIDKMRGKNGSSDYRQASPMMRAIMSKIVNEDLTNLLKDIKCPTLLIWGEKDTATPLSDAKTMERLIPDAGLVVYPGASHFSFLEHPAQTRAVIRSFFDLH